MEERERGSGIDRRQSNRRLNHRRIQDQLPSYEFLVHELECSHNEVKKLIDAVRDLTDKQPGTH